jgi:hypothetical protein
LQQKRNGEAKIKVTDHSVAKVPDTLGQETERVLSQTLYAGNFQSDWI